LNLYLKISFGGGSEDHRKIPWINWNTVCLKKEDDRLGVRQLREFNLALLGKWCWKMLVDRGGFWYRVLTARYGEEAVRLEVARIKNGIGDGGEG